MLRRRKPKHKEIVVQETEDSKGPSNCIICLDRVSCRGKLSVCDHWFCYTCILEWSKNTNTCPICKARFRCITKVHLSPLKSPPQKVRVSDKDQRVWDDDETLTPEQILDILDDDDFDDDYEPPIHVADPWTRARRMGDDSFLDEFDFDDSFIDDTELSQVLTVRLRHDLTYGEHSEEEDSEASDVCEELTNRESPYALRSARQSAISGMMLQVAAAACSVSVIELSDVESETRSIPSSDSFVVSDEDSSESDFSPNDVAPTVDADTSGSDDIGDDWVPFGNNRLKNSNKTKAKKKTSKRLCAKKPSRARQTTSVKTSSSRTNTTRKETKRRSTAVKSSHHRKQKEALSRDKLDDANGWIDMSRSNPSGTSSSLASTEPSTSGLQTRTTSKSRCPGRELRTLNPNSSRSRVRELRVREPKDYGFISEEDNESGESSDFEELSLRAGVKRKKETSSESEEDCNLLHLEPSTSSRRTVENRDKHERKSYLSSIVTEDNTSESETFIEPSPHVSTKRSIFTKRRHRSPANSFGESAEDNGSPLKKRSKQRGSHKGDYTPGSNCSEPNASKRNLMQHKAFESKNSTNSRDNCAKKSFHSNKAAASSSSTGYYRTHGEKKQLGLVYDSKTIDPRASSTTTIRTGKQKRKRIVSFDSDSD